MHDELLNFYFILLRIRFNPVEASEGSSHAEWMGKTQRVMKLPLFRIWCHPLSSMMRAEARD